MTFARGVLEHASTGFKDCEWVVATAGPLLKELIRKSWLAWQWILGVKVGANRLGWLTFVVRTAWAVRTVVRKRVAMRR